MSLDEKYGLRRSLIQRRLLQCAFPPFSPLSSMSTLLVTILPGTIFPSTTTYSSSRKQCLTNSDHTKCASATSLREVDFLLLNKLALNESNDSQLAGASNRLAATAQADALFLKAFVDGDGPWTLRGPWRCVSFRSGPFIWSWDACADDHFVHILRASATPTRACQSDSSLPV